MRRRVVVSRRDGAARRGAEFPAPVCVFREFPGAQIIRLPAEVRTIARAEACVEGSTVDGAAAAALLPRVDAADWLRGEADWRTFDREVGDAAAGPLRPFLVAGRDDAELGYALPRILTRLQGCLPRRNAHSSGALFERVLAAHRSLHDLGRPLVRADFNHALDTWQWLLRLDPHAGAAVQLAALFHDVERLESEAERRVEHHAADYEAFKRAHAQAGAGRMRAVLLEAGAPLALVEAAAALVAVHEEPGEDAGRGERHERALLNDADALSFFSLNSPGFLAYFGEAHARRKVAYTLRRMSGGARRRLTSLALPSRISDFVAEALASSGPQRTTPARPAPEGEGSWRSASAADRG